MGAPYTVAHAVQYEPDRDQLFPRRPQASGGPFYLTNLPEMNSGRFKGPADRLTPLSRRRGLRPRKRQLSFAPGAPASSNLYPTPHTVFSAHWLLTFSIFSRSRLMWTSTVRLSPK